MSSYGDDLHLHSVTSANGLWCHYGSLYVSDGSCLQTFETMSGYIAQ
jgi:hypothetical protein